METGADLAYEGRVGFLSAAAEREEGYERGGSRERKEKPMHGSKAQRPQPINNISSSL